MGITGEIVKTVFARGRHHHLHTTHVGSMISRVEKKRWKASVRSYLCGDHEHDDSVIADDEVVSFGSSTVAEAGLDSFRSNRAADISICTTWESSDTIPEDATSIRTSEATVNQPYDGNLKAELREVCFQQEEAALIIQSAFRAFRAKRAQEKARMWDERCGHRGSPSNESIGTSIEVQTGNSSDIFSIKEGSFGLRHTLRNRTKAQVLKIQDWDDSTVSSVISKMRIRNKMEAATRRERALAYAFSQQLRICSKTKQCTPKGDETNTGWTWLERWMATRQPEMIDLTEDKDSVTNGVKAIVCKKIMDASMEEKESCGSNEVSMLFENGFRSVGPKNVPRPGKMIRTKATRSFARQNLTSSHLCPKDVKKVQHLEDEKKKRKRARQPSLANKKELRNTATRQLPIEHGDVPSILIN